MIAKDTKNIVVDADVATSSGSNKNYQAVNSREFMECMRICGHRIVLSLDIQTEWIEHGSYFAIDWLATMTENSQIHDTGDAKDEKLRKRISKYASDIHIYRIMIKDVHLLEAARMSDMTVSSMDKKAHFHFCSVCSHIIEIQDVMWVNPDYEAEACIDWLKHGAPVEAQRQLGYQHRNK